MKACYYCKWWIQYSSDSSTLNLKGYCSEHKIETDTHYKCDDGFKHKTQKWGNREIPNRNCYKEGKKCTTDCNYYDMGWLYSEDD